MLYVIEAKDLAIQTNEILESIPQRTLFQIFWSNLMKIHPFGSFPTSSTLLWELPLL